MHDKLKVGDLVQSTKEEENNKYGFNKDSIGIVLGADFSDPEDQFPYTVHWYNVTYHGVHTFFHAVEGIKLYEPPSKTED